MRGRALIAALATFLGTASVAQTQLRYDPFAGAALDRQDRGGEASGGFSPTLYATLVAGEHSLVDLGGQVLRVGESAHGYRLIEVRAFEAVFQREGTRLVLPLSERSAKRGP